MSDFYATAAHVVPETSGVDPSAMSRLGNPIVFALHDETQLMPDEITTAATLEEVLAAVSALADEWEATGPAWIDPPIGAATELRAALTTTPTPAAEVGRREESGR